MGLTQRCLFCSLLKLFLFLGVLLAAKAVFAAAYFSVYYIGPEQLTGGRRLPSFDDGVQIGQASLEVTDHDQDPQYQHMTLYHDIPSELPVRKQVHRARSYAVHRDQWSWRQEIYTDNHSQDKPQTVQDYSGQIHEDDRSKRRTRYIFNQAGQKELDKCVVNLPQLSCFDINKAVSTLTKNDELVELALWDPSSDHYINAWVGYSFEGEAKERIKYLAFFEVETNNVVGGVQVDYSKQERGELI
ncbi:MAG: hypothetical protein MI784_00200, partial [Cytophagales bacterium]|nr:hypothetical protein [Cytophagales bacterium]